jgi:hypothetical protein
MPEPVDIICTVDEQGRIPPSRTDFVRGALRRYAGGQVRIRLSKPVRSPAANRYYWGVVIREIQRAAVEAGYLVTSEGLHELFKGRYLPQRTSDVFGQPVTLPPTTTELDAEEFAEYIDRILSDDNVVELGVYVPAPGEYQAEHGRFTSTKIAEPA